MTKTLYFLVLSPIFFLGILNSPALAKSKPNIIFMIADDLNDSLGIMNGHPQALTPALDALAEQGVLFNNAQVNSPICGPSRASLLTGLEPRTTGYYGYNFIEDHWRDNTVLKHAVTIPEHFRAHGYQVLLTGKIYHNNQEDVSVWYQQGIPPSWGPWPWDGTADDAYEHGTLSPWRNTLAHPAMPAGFGIDNSFASLANIPNVKANPTENIPGYQGWRLFFEPFHYKNENDRDLLPDELNAQWVIAQLNKKHNKPFLMLVGFNRPHTPMYVPQEYLDKFPLDTLQLAPNKADDLHDLAKGFTPADASFSTQGYGYYKYQQVMEHGEVMLKKWLQAYLASVNFVDEQVDKILSALQNSEYADNTYVVFTSDHGYHIGEKQMLFKNSPWEESTRVPLIIAGPGIDKGYQQEQPVTLVDLFPTFNAWANISQAPNIKTNQKNLDGHSLAPLLQSNTEQHWTGPEVALTSIASSNKLQMRQAGDIEQQHHSIRSKRYRYILSAAGGEELYDHRHDPHEWHNLANAKQYQRIRKQLRNSLDKLLKQNKK